MHDAPFVFFSDDDIEIIGDDVCSRCRRRISEDEVPLMLFREHAGRSGRGSVDVARFHEKCFNELIRAGIIKLAPPGCR